VVTDDDAVLVLRVCRRRFFFDDPDSEDSGVINSEFTIAVCQDWHVLGPPLAAILILNILCIDVFGHHNSYLGQEGFTPVHIHLFRPDSVDGRGLGNIRSDCPRRIECTG
jgi:hypothetical protein